MAKELELRLQEAEASAQKARADLATVERKIADTQAVVNAAAARRQVHALPAATGDAKASAALAKIKKETADAETDLADLEAALPEARRRAALAEQTLSTARIAVSRDAMMQNVKKRIDVAKEVDHLTAVLAAKWNEFFELGHQIEVGYVEMLGERGVGYSGANIEALHGMQRVIDAMPVMMRRFFPTEIRLPRQPQSLAAAEATFWNFPNEDHSKGAAAA